MKKTIIFLALIFSSLSQAHEPLNLLKSLGLKNYGCVVLLQSQDQMMTFSFPATAAAKSMDEALQIAINKFEVRPVEIGNESKGLYSSSSSIKNSLRSQGYEVTTTLIKDISCSPL